MDSIEAAVQADVTLGEAEVLDASLGASADVVAVGIDLASGAPADVLAVAAEPDDVAGPNLEGAVEPAGGMVVDPWRDMMERRLSRLEKASGLSGEA
jgi:hypothetical protein